MIKLIIFDFDGVIADSVSVKTEAFMEIFKQYPDKLKQIRDFHLRNGGMSRFDKFHYIYSKILKKPLAEKEFNELCEKFSKLVFKKVISAPFIKGAEDFLEYCSKRRYQMHVISATPDQEIREIVKRRRLDKYFKEVKGSPRPKIDLIKEVLKKNNCKPYEAIYIGDAINDYYAAKESGVRFIAKIRENNKNFKDVKPDFSISNLRQLQNILDNEKI